MSADGAVKRGSERLRESAAAGLLTALVVVTAVTLVIYPLQEIDPGVSSGVLYVLGVLGISLTWGLRLGLVTSLASALALWLFHTSPSAGLGEAELEDVVAIAIMLATSVVAAGIADRARSRAEEAESRLALEARLRRADAERIRLEEVQASRARVVAAGDATRKRVVRDLHDGAQQRLVHTVVTLKLAGRALSASDTEEAGVLVDEAVGHAEAAIAELRELAHGILPAVLSRGGLSAAVPPLTDRVPIPVTVEIEPDRLPPEYEATAYFVIAEALTNVAKHAGATSATVRAACADGELVLEIADDGVGGARVDGGGLTGLGDRLAVLGGELTVGNVNGRGTCVRAVIPLPA